MIKELLVFITILTTPQQSCEPTIYNSFDGTKHLYEITPTKETTSLYCVYHNEIESVYRLIPNIKDVEEYNTITHQTYQNINEINSTVMTFAHKLGENVEETDFTLKVSVDGEEYVYFIIPSREKH
jgi:hypothetical protein